MCVYVPFLVSAVLALTVPRTVPRLPPRLAAWALTCAALVMAGAWVGALVLLAVNGAGQIPEIAERGPWSAKALQAEDPVSSIMSVACGLALLVTAVALVVVSSRRARILIEARRECRRLPGDGELAVLDHEGLEAFALPGAPGRIVVSRGMLCTLDHPERKALLAHERAHLRGRHHLFVIGWQLAATVNPLLRPLVTAGGFLLERWADEDAAASVGDRTLVARAVARAALATSGKQRHVGVLAATGGPVPRRVQALLAPPPPPRQRRFPLVAGALLLALCCGSLVEAAADTDNMFKVAMYASCAPAAHHPAGPSTALALTAPDEPSEDHREDHAGKWRTASGHGDCDPPDHGAHAPRT
jgi:Zn-dependent protease with chaperone function